MSNNKTLQAYVRYDGTGRIIPGSLILSRLKPKVGNWQPTQTYECCDTSCAIPVYGITYAFGDIIELETGIIVPVDNYSNTGLEIALFSCSESNIITSTIVYIPAGASSYEVFYGNAQLIGTCGVAVRKVCSLNYNSQWVYQTI